MTRRGNDGRADAAGALESKKRGRRAVSMTYLQQGCLTQALFETLSLHCLIYSEPYGSGHWTFE